VFLALLYRRQIRKFAPAVFLGSLGFAATLNLLNVDRFIANRNIERFLSGATFEKAQGRSYPEVDLGYLLTLSADVMPELKRLVDQGPPLLRDQLLAQMACSQYAGYRYYNRDSWQSYHFSIARHERFLDELEPELEGYSVVWDADNYVDIVTGPMGSYECKGYYGYGW
jgi:hypothetical protein